MSRIRDRLASILSRMVDALATPCLCPLDPSETPYWPSEWFMDGGRI